MKDIFLTVLFLIAISCSSSGVKSLSNAPSGLTFSRTGEYKLGVNDVIQIRVNGQKDFDGEYIISHNGTMNLPLVGAVHAKDRTERQLYDSIKRKLIPFIRAPEVSLSIVKYESYKVYIAGTVRSPGVFIFKDPTTIAQAIATAGGLTNLSNGDLILHRKSRNGVVFKYLASFQDVIEGKGKLENFILERGDVLYVE